MKNICLLFFVILFTKEYSQNNALSFQWANNNDVRLNYSPALDFDKNDLFSIEAWVKTDAFYAAIIWSNHVDIQPFTGTEAAIVNGKAVLELLKDHQTDGIRVETIMTVNDNQWHHLAFVYHGIPNGNTIDIYIDGTLQTLNISTNNLSSSVKSPNNVHIGSRNNTTYFSNITLDELRVWKKALCASEVQARKNCSLNGDEPQLEAYYNFNQGFAGGNNPGLTTLTDLSGNAHHGILTGFALNSTTSNWIASTAPVTGKCGAYGGLTTSGQSTVCSGKSVTGSASGALTNGILVYPNPARDRLYLSDDSEVSTVQIYNPLGELILSESYSKTVGIDLSHFNKGLYILYATLGNTRITSRFIKEP